MSALQEQVLKQLRGRGDHFAVWLKEHDSREALWLRWKEQRMPRMVPAGPGPSHVLGRVEPVRRSAGDVRLLCREHGVVAGGVAGLRLAGCEGCEGEEGRRRRVGVRAGEEPEEGVSVEAMKERVREMKEREKREVEEKEGAKYVRMERRVGKFMRKFVLPEDANIEKISAVCQDGVLTVNVEKLPPPEPKKPKTIEVKIA